jgi:hypothetical protein
MVRFGQKPVRNSTKDSGRTSNISGVRRPRRSANKPKHGRAERARSQCEVGCDGDLDERRVRVLRDLRKYERRAGPGRERPWPNRGKLATNLLR